MLRARRACVDAIGYGRLDQYVQYVQNGEPSREVGLDLLRATSAFDRPLGVRHEIGAVDLALVAFAFRARRLMRAAFAVLDAAMADVASVLFRVMGEYLFVGRWLIDAGDAGHEAWAINDLRERRVTILDTLAQARLEALDDAVLRAELATLEADITRHLGGIPALSKRAARKAGLRDVPSLQTMAGEAGLGFVYAFAYRLQSQTDVHATPLAVDCVFDPPEGSQPGPKLRRVPRHALQGFDPYEVGARLLLDIVRPVPQRIPQFDFAAQLDELDARLAEIAASRDTTSEP